MFPMLEAQQRTYPELEKGYEKLKKKLDEIKKASSPAEGLKLLEELSTSLTEYKEGARDEINRIEELFEELNKEFDNLIARVEKTKLDPHSAVTFVRFVRVEQLGKKKDVKVTIIEVQDGTGRIVRVPFVVDGYDVNTLKYGQQLLCPNNQSSAMYVDEVTDEFKKEGVTGSIVEVLENDLRGPRYLIAAGAEQNTLRVMHATPIILPEILTKGKRVLVDPSASLIIEVLPPLDTSHNYLVAEVPDVTFGDIGGLDDLKREVEELLIHPILFAAIAKRMGEPRSKGCTLKGPPGVGKTTLGKAIVNRFHEIRCEQLGLDPKKIKPLFYSINGPELLDKFVGEAERKIRELFEEARRKSKQGIPVGIFIDEAEALLGIRGSGISSDMEKTIVPMFTSEMQGLEESGSENVFVILASNLAHMIDGAVKRPGRCDQIFTVPRPDESGSGSILEKYLSADWNQLHPQYNVDRYTVHDENGKPRTDEKDNVESHQFKNDPKRVQAYLIKETVARIFENANRTVVAQLTYEGGIKQTIHYKDLVSGAVLADVVKRAKRLARTRYVNSLIAQKELSKAEEYLSMSTEDLIKRNIQPLGVKLEDLFHGVDQVYGEIEVPKDSVAMRHWLLIENLLHGRQITEVSFTKDSR